MYSSPLSSLFWSCQMIIACDVQCWSKLSLKARRYHFWSNYVSFIVDNFNQLVKKSDISLLIACCTDEAFLSWWSKTIPVQARWFQQITIISLIISMKVKSKHKWWIITFVNAVSWCSPVIVWLLKLLIIVITQKNDLIPLIMPPALIIKLLIDLLINWLITNSDHQSLIHPDDNSFHWYLIGNLLLISLLLMMILPLWSVIWCSSPKSADSSCTDQS